MDRLLTRIVVIHPGALGDTLLALPVLAALKRSYRPALLGLIGHPALVKVLPGRSVVDHMRSIDGPEFHALVGEPDRMTSDLKAVFEDADIAIAWMADAEGQLSRSLSQLGIPRVIVQSPRLREPGFRHATGRYHDVVSELECSLSLLPPALRPTERDLESGQAWMARVGLQADRRPVVAVHPGSGSQSKCWPVDRFAGIIRDLLREGTDVLVLEGPADGPAVEALGRMLAPIAFPRMINEDLATVLGVLAQCRAYLGNDSGLTHLAASLDLPTVCLFGPTDPSVWAPLGDHVVVIRGEAECHCPTPADRWRCLNRACFSVPARRVWEALQNAVFDAV